MKWCMINHAVASCQGWGAGNRVFPLEQSTGRYLMLNYAEKTVLVLSYAEKMMTFGIK